MRVTMVKKRLLGGEACKKCVQAEDMLKARGLWPRVDEVVWAVEGDPESPGMKLSAQYRVELAPFFIVENEGTAPRVYTSTVQFIKEALGGGTSVAPVTAAGAPLSTAELASLSVDFDSAPPERTV